MPIEISGEFCASIVSMIVHCPLSYNVAIMHSGVTDDADGADAGNFTHDVIRVMRFTERGADVERIIGHPRSEAKYPATSFSAALPHGSVLQIMAVEPLAAGQPRYQQFQFLEIGGMFDDE